MAGLPASCYTLLYLTLLLLLVILLSLGEFQSFYVFVTLRTVEGQSLARKCIIVCFKILKMISNTNRRSGQLHAVLCPVKYLIFYS